MTRDEYDDDDDDDDDDGRRDTTADARVMDGQTSPVQGQGDDHESSSLGEYICRYRPPSSLFPPFFDPPDVVVDGVYMPW